MGRDEHKTSRGKRHLAQTPKNQITRGVDVELAAEYVQDTKKRAGILRPGQATGRVRGHDENNN